MYTRPYRISMIRNYESNNFVNKVTEHHNVWSQNIKHKSFRQDHTEPVSFTSMNLNLSAITSGLKRSSVSHVYMTIQNLYEHNYESKVPFTRGLNADKKVKTRHHFCVLSSDRHRINIA